MFSFGSTLFYLFFIFPGIDVWADRCVGLPDHLDVVLSTGSLSSIESKDVKRFCEQEILMMI